MTKNINQFDQDVISHRGYLYTTKASRSSLLANQRQTEITKSTIGKIKGKRVIDVGCGDGTYTYKLYKWGGPKLMIGIDVAEKAIKKAQKQFAQKNKNLIFEHYSCYKMPYKKGSFDIAIVRGLLHHLDHPVKGLTKIVEVSDQVFIIEPNGYNPILKLIERLSPYHRKHKEKSYAPITLRRWIKNLERKIVKENYVGLVPFFCPDWLAYMLKKLEPFVEKTPILRNLFCASYAAVITN